MLFWRPVFQGALIFSREKKMNEQYMRRALELAKKGEGHTSPNPMVGCVVVKDGRIIAEGYHERYGGFHAERNALTNLAESAEGADLYVTLEPCCHYGKTPPCTEIIIEKKTGRVFMGSLDVNPLVAGKGVRILREHGIEVHTGILEKECLDLNEVFYHYMSANTPFVAAKYAMSLDGKIACASGDSKWVTGEEARQQVQVLRKRYTGIMAGIGTVLSDDPMLNCRCEDPVDPVRIICDSALRIPADCRILRTAGEIRTILACTEQGYEEARQSGRLAKIADSGAEIVLAGRSGQVDLRKLMKELASRKVDSILLEGGGTLNAAAFEAGIVNKVYAFIAGKIIGGKDAKTPVEGMGAAVMSETVKLERLSVERFGEDICITGYVL